MADGNRFSGNGVRGGLYPVLDGYEDGLPYTDMRYEETDAGALLTFSGTPCGTVRFHLTEAGVRIETRPASTLRLVFRFEPGAAGLPARKRLDGKEIQFTYEGYKTIVKLADGHADEDLVLWAEEGMLSLSLAEHKEGGK